MTIKDMNMTHKKILFLISLPQTKGFEKYQELVNWCVNKLREKCVDVRETIHREDLACISLYDIVIVVAHHNVDENVLCLSDGKLSIDTFINSLPENFCGVLDFSSCYSSTVKEAIKQRCPNCFVQVAKEETRLAVRLVAYPFVVDLINENKDKDYHFNYMEGLHMGEEAAAGNPDDDEYYDDSLRLGQKKASIFAPLEAKRKSHVPINVFIHCDSEKNEVRIKAARGTEVHINSEDLGEVKDDDYLTLTLSFMQCDDIQFLHIEGPDSKDIIVTNELIKEYFIVKIDEEYNAPNFGCYIHILKNGEEIRKYPIFIEVVDYNNRPQTEIMANNQDNTANNSDERDACSYVEDFSTMKKYQLKGSGPRNLKEVYSFLNENNIIPPFVDLSYLWNCITHAYFTPLWGNDNNTFILHLMHKAKKGFVDEKEWADAACKSIGTERSRLGKNPPSEKKYGEKMPDLEFKH